MNDTKPDKKHRRIATVIFLLLFVTGYLFAWPAYQRRTVIRKLERAGATIVRDGSPPRWLRQWGMESGNVVGIYGDGPQYNDDILRHVSLLTNVEEMQLHETTISTRGLARLGDLTELKDLEIGSNARLSSDGLRHLTRLKKLRTLKLSSAEIDDRGLGHLRSLPSLEDLGLFDTHITDEGLRQLGRMVNLQYLTIDSPHITDNGVSHLDAMPSLRWLTLVDTQVTDDGINTFHCPVDLKFRQE